MCVGGLLVISWSKSAFVASTANNVVVGDITKGDNALGWSEIGGSSTQSNGNTRGERSRLKFLDFLSPTQFPGGMRRSSRMVSGSIHSVPGAKEG